MSHLDGPNSNTSEIDGELRSCADIFGTAGTETGEDHTPRSAVDATDGAANPV
jgi:hypothetical protein